MFLQESRVPKCSAVSLQKSFFRAGFDLSLGPQPALSRVKGSAKILRQGHGGVAALVRKDIPYQQISIPDDFFRNPRPCTGALVLSWNSPEGLYLL